MAGFGQDPVPGMTREAERIVPAPPEARKKWSLRILAGPRAGSSIALEEGEYVVGRNDPPSLTVDLDLTDAELGDPPMLSRRHAKISVASGAVTIEDLGSTNGTYVDGGRLPAHVPRKVEIGGTKARLANLDVEFVLDRD